MATTNVYNVAWHFEVSGKNVSQIYEANVSAAANDYTSLNTVLQNNTAALGALGRPTVWPGGTLVIDSCEAYPSGAQTIYT